MSSQVIFILGGAASGKSAYAESVARKCNRPMIYLASARAQDGEMRRKIADHIDRRGPEWRTIEAPLNAAQELRTLTPDTVCLFDCATMWLNNQMMTEKPLRAPTADLLDAVTACTADLVIVSNEVGHGIVPENALARAFREAQGRLNIALAERADCVVQVIAGLPLALKGTLP